MDFLNLAKKRYSCRNYDSKAVEQEKLDLILEAGRIAPSAANLQPWHFIVIRQKENLEKIGKVYPREWFMRAPCVIILCGDHSKSWKRKDQQRPLLILISRSQLITLHSRLQTWTWELAGFVILMLIFAVSCSIYLLIWNQSYFCLLVIRLTPQILKDTDHKGNL